MASTTTAAAAAVLPFSSLRRRVISRTLKPPAPLIRSTANHRQSSIQLIISCHVSITGDASPSSSSSFSEKIGRKIRVKAPVKVYHVAKLPQLDLYGRVGIVKQYVGVWKGKKITPNLPFKVEFSIQLDGLDAPVKFFAHLREDEFECLPSDVSH